jgi:hypothetical protein
MGIALVNTAMHHNNSATHRGARSSARNTAHAVDKKTVESERNRSTMRSVFKNKQRIAGAFLTDRLDARVSLPSEAKIRDVWNHTSL